jgi:hypothetical protein
MWSNLLAPVASATAVFFFLKIFIKDKKELHGEGIVLNVEKLWMSVQEKTIDGKILVPCSGESKKILQGYDVRFIMDGKFYSLCPKEAFKKGEKV